MRHAIVKLVIGHHLLQHVSAGDDGTQLDAKHVCTGKLSMERVHFLRRRADGQNAHTNTGRRGERGREGADMGKEKRIKDARFQTSTTHVNRCLRNTEVCSLILEEIWDPRKSKGSSPL